MLKKKSTFFKWKLQVKCFNQKFRQKISLWKFTWSFHLKIIEKNFDQNFIGKVSLNKSDEKKSATFFGEVASSITKATSATRILPSPIEGSPSENFRIFQ